MNTDDKSRKPRSEKTIKQKIASAQMRLNRLKTKEKSLSKSAETRLKIILGAEVAKAAGCKVEDVDKEFVLGLILQSSNISIEDKARLKLRGKRFLEDMVGRQKWSTYNREKPQYNLMR
ncbi:conjugal transfer TraD family protein [Escherichia coli]|uniref:conjugal transfer protein TraD n=2 Tax=Escherichia coli TaxID=562 RepID=UPI0007A5F3D2|nr:conjugal transfer protein TraD [Escherichia coli]EEV6081754.1 conjugal transfer TraD family protein [Escherichia coli]EEV6139244.1 conjugal transfer TraD family protein [Escherichia coli]EEZ5272009.1 conjugal transfer protein TraD [Escherichia coli]EFA6918227.1 conjugal transfer protein TraD [Escherichia coli]EFB6175096.1 conjugal transfer protein TraD [Escherichia coli]